MFDIITDATPPSEKPRTRSDKKYPIAELEPGHCFKVPNIEANPPWELISKASKWQNISSLVSRSNRKYVGERVFRYVLSEDKCWFEFWRVS